MIKISEFNIKSLMIQAVKIGLLGGVVAVFLSLIGMVESFSQRYIVSDIISMGHTLLLLVGVFFGYFAAQRTKNPRPILILLGSLLAGLLVGALSALLVILGSVVNLRSVFLNATPVLYELLTFKQECGECAGQRLHRRSQRPLVQRLDRPE